MEPPQPVPAAFVELFDPTGAKRELWLDAERAAAGLTIGRHQDSDLCISWDGRVSRRHARLAAVDGRHWFVEDLASHNGTAVNGVAIAGSHPLSDRNTILVGATVLLFRQPAAGGAAVAFDGDVEGVSSTTPNWTPVGPVGLTAAQRAVLGVLLAPYRRGELVAAPPGDGEIAAALRISRHTVKSHVRALYAGFGLSSDTSEHKRRELVARALAHAVAPSESDGREGA